MKKFSIFFLLGILILAFVLRLYKFDNPIADWHSWRQVDTSAVSRDFANSGFNLLRPTYEDLSNVPTTGKYENPNGYRFVEFPIYNVFQAGFYKLLDNFTLEEWGRMVTILASLLSISFIYLLLKKYTDEYAALSAAFFYAVIPYNIYYGRVILPDPMTVTTILGGIYFFDLWVDEVKDKKRVVRNILFFSLALIFTASSFLLKPFALFFVLPMLVIVFNAFGFSFIKKWYLWIFAFLALVPIILWRLWIAQYPEGVPESNWLLNGGNIRFKGAFFNWIFSIRIGGLILGFWGATLLTLGILFNSNSEKIYGFKKGQQLLFWSFLASSLTYLFVVARGNVQHDYYQILIMPTIAIFVGLGIKFLIHPPKELIKQYISIPILIVSLFFMIAFQWLVVRDFFNINNFSIITAGAAVDRLVPKDAKVIANYEGDTTFLYQTKRKGWASYEHDLDEMRDKLGADFLVIANPVSSDFEFATKYMVIEQTPQYIIFNLRSSP